MGNDRVRAHSAEAAFFIMMSVFPVLMLLLTLVLSMRRAGWKG